MKELIKEAEKLYKQIGEKRRDLVIARTSCSAEMNSLAVANMEVAMCEVFQFLKRIVDRKDNIVDLGEAWHSVDEEPDRTRNILIDESNIIIDSSSYVCNTISPLLYDGRWKHIVNKLNVMRWAYIEDLLPKGGE